MLSPDSTTNEWWGLPASFLTSVYFSFFICEKGYMCMLNVTIHVKCWEQCLALMVNAQQMELLSFLLLNEYILYSSHCLCLLRSLSPYSFGQVTLPGLVPLQNMPFPIFKPWFCLANINLVSLIQLQQHLFLEAFPGSPLSLHPPRRC